MRNVSRALLVLLCLAPLISQATDTLNCPGEEYSIWFHVGSEGIGDFTLFGREGPLAEGGAVDLDVVKFEWHESDDHSRNAIIVNTKDGFVVPFKLEASGERGSLEVENVAVSIACDWEK